MRPYWHNRTCATPWHVCSALVPQRPNVVIILADDLGYADIGMQGISKDVQTPNVDSIAKNGVRFTQAYVSCPVCALSRRSAEREISATVRLRAKPKPQRTAELRHARRSDAAASHPQRRRVRDGHAGEMASRVPSAAAPDEQGLQRLFRIPGRAHTYLALGAGQNVVLDGRDAADSVSYLTTDFGKGAEKFVDANKDKPFFLYLAFNAIHTPMQAPDSYLEKYKDVKDPLRQKTLAMISAMDDAIGGVMERIRAR